MNRSGGGVGGGRPGRFQRTPHPNPPTGRAAALYGRSRCGALRGSSAPTDRAEGQSSVFMAQLSRVGALSSNVWGKNPSRGPVRARRIFVLRLCLTFTAQIPSLLHPAPVPGRAPRRCPQLPASQLPPPCRGPTHVPTHRTAVPRIPTCFSHRGQVGSCPRQWASV